MCFSVPPQAISGLKPLQKKSLSQRQKVSSAAEAKKNKRITERNIFRFTAALRKHAPGQRANRVIAEEAERTIRQKLGSKRILLMEDEPMNCEIAQVLLEDVGFIVDLAEDGGKAIERVQALPMI